VESVLDGSPHMGSSILGTSGSFSVRQWGKGWQDLMSKVPLFCVSEAEKPPCSNLAAAVSKTLVTKLQALNLVGARGEVARGTLAVLPAYV
jgi:hypothetical protein